MKINKHSILFKRNWQESEYSVYIRILKYLSVLDTHNNGEEIAEVSSHVALPKSFQPIYKTTKDYNKNIEIKNYIKPKNYIYWLIGLLKNNVKLLKEFNVNRKNLNSEILMGNESDATKHLNNINNISFSVWGAEMLVHVIKELGKKETKEIINSLFDGFDESYRNQYQKKLLLSSESNNISLYIQAEKEQIKEYNSSNIDYIMQYGLATVVQSLPRTFDLDSNLSLDLLFYKRHESIIDQYILLKAILSENPGEIAKLSNSTKNNLEYIAKFAGDEELVSILKDEGHENDFINEVILQYTGGDYSRVFSMIAERLESGSKDVWGLIEIYARSKLYIKNVEARTFYDVLANALIEILEVSSNAIESINFIRRICVKFRHEAWAKSLHYHFLSLLEESEGEAIVEKSRKQLVVLGDYNTPKAREVDVKNFIENGVGDVQIPEHRLVKYGLHSKRAEEISENDSPIFSDFLKIKSCAYLQEDKWYEAIVFSVGCYIKNRRSVYFLPFERMCRHINGVLDFDGDRYILSILALDIYGKEFSNAYGDLKSELFDDYLSYNKTHKPSIIFKGQSLSGLDRYFLREICIPSQLDDITDFNSNDEVVYERLQILDLLCKDAGELEREDLIKERERTIEKLFSERLRARIETGKLYVDVQALEQKKKDSYKAYYEQAQSLDGGILLPQDPDFDGETASDDIVHFDKKTDEELSVVLASSNKAEILYSIFMQAANDFAFNEDYGLDKYLSAEIRHNVFVIQLRSCFQKSNLITQMSHGEYLNNIFWRDKYNYVSNSVLDPIDLILKSFSRNIDTILSDVNERFRVTVDHRDKTAIFRFVPYYKNVARLSLLLDNCINFDEFFQATVLFMWELADECAQSALNIINYEMKPKILDALNQLEQEIVAAKQDVAMVDLIEEIASSRTSFTKEIEIVSNWFRFVGANSESSQEKLAVVVEAAKLSFESIYGQGFLSVEGLQDSSAIFLNYREARSLFMSIFTALENAAKYGVNSTVKIKHRTYESFEEILICNWFGSDSAANKKDFVEEQRTKWIEGPSKLSRTEGGSGIYKIYNFLKNASSGFSLDIQIASGEFVCCIGMRNENFTCGR